MQLSVEPRGASCAVAHRLGKIPGKDDFLEHVHLALYKRKGTANARKKEIRAFTGWTFGGDRKVRNHQRARYPASRIMPIRLNVAAHISHCFLAGELHACAVDSATQLLLLAEQANILLCAVGLTAKHAQELTGRACFVRHVFHTPTQVLQRWLWHTDKAQGRRKQQPTVKYRQVMHLNKADMLRLPQLP